MTTKEFTVRDSLLTTLFNTENGSSLYRCVIIFSLLAISVTAIVSFVHNETVEIGQTLLLKHLRGVPFTFVSFAVMYSLVLLLYLNFVLWSTNRLKHKPRLAFVWDSLFLFPAIILMCGLIIFPPAATVLFNLHKVCSIALILRQLEIFFKIVSFLRNKTPQVLKGDATVPTLKEMFLYLLVPTFIYKDKYPRSEEPIRWKLLMQNSLELVWCAVVGAYLATVMQRPMLKFRSLWLDTPMALEAVGSNIGYTTSLFFVWFFAYLHSFPNLMAELTRFQDRMFYKDWWNSTSYRDFFLKWNTLYQDWLYHCVYLETRNITKSSTIAACAAFIVAILFHEWFLAFTLKFFFPIIGAVYICYGVVMVIEPVVGITGNAIFWFSMILGVSAIYAAFMMEIFSRINCPLSSDADFILKYVVPRCWSCPLAE